VFTIVQSLLQHEDLKDFAAEESVQGASMEHFVSTTYRVKSMDFPKSIGLPLFCMRRRSRTLCNSLATISWGKVTSGAALDLFGCRSAEMSSGASSFSPGVGNLHEQIQNDGRRWSARTSRGENWLLECRSVSSTRKRVWSLLYVVFEILPYVR
jgi:hypothetical protein